MLVYRAMSQAEFHRYNCGGEVKSTGSFKTKKSQWRNGVCFFADYTAAKSWAKVGDVIAEFDVEENLLAVGYGVYADEMWQDEMRKEFNAAAYNNEDFNLVSYEIKEDW